MLFLWSTFPYSLKRYRDIDDIPLVFTRGTEVTKHYYYEIGSEVKVRERQREMVTSCQIGLSRHTAKYLELYNYKQTHTLNIHIPLPKLSPSHTHTHTL